mgnify:CR=1 FL=1
MIVYKPPPAQHHGLSADKSRSTFRAVTHTCCRSQPNSFTFSPYLRAFATFVSLQNCNSNAAQSTPIPAGSPDLPPCWLDQTFIHLSCASTYLETQSPIISQTTSRLWHLSVPDPNFCPFRSSWLKPLCKFTPGSIRDLQRQHRWSQTTRFHLTSLVLPCRGIQRIAGFSLSLGSQHLLPNSTWSNMAATTS